jgi:hypothetical protein
MFEIKKLKADTASEALEDELAETAPQTAARLETARKIDADLKEGSENELLASQWQDTLKAYEASGQTGKPEGWTDEQFNYLLDLKAKAPKPEASAEVVAKQDVAAERPKPEAKGRWGKVDRNADKNPVAEKAEPVSEPVVAEARDDFQPEIEIGAKYEVEINQEMKKVIYAGDTKDGKAVMVTEKGARLLSKGLAYVLEVGEIFPNEMFVAVDKDSLKEQKAAA